MVGDPISDLITRIKTGSMANKESLSLPFSNLKFAIANLLVKEGYVTSVEKKSDGKALEIVLKYENGQSKIQGIERVSKQSKRVYGKSSEIKPFKNGFGNMIITTSKGIMTGRQAFREKIGGEVLFKIW